MDPLAGRYKIDQNWFSMAMCQFWGITISYSWRILIPRSILQRKWGRGLGGLLHDFEGFLRRNDLIDIDLQGPVFTWFKDRLGENLMQVRLEREPILASWDILQHTSLKEDLGT